MGKAEDLEGGARDLAFLVGRDHPDLGPALLAADPPLGWPAGVRLGVQGQPKHLQAVDDGGPKRGAVLADASGEHEGVEATEHGGIGPHVLAQPVHGDVVVSYTHLTLPTSDLV